MSMPTVIAAIVVIGLGTAQYILMVQSLRDLGRRPRVRGDNKVAWALVILCVPIIGPLVYGWMGPTSLIRRPQALPPQPGSGRNGTGSSGSRHNITPISEARRRPDSPHRPTANARLTRNRFRRTGS